MNNNSNSTTADELRGAMSGIAAGISSLGDLFRENDQLLTILLEQLRLKGLDTSTFELRHYSRIKDDGKTYIEFYLDGELRHCLRSSLQNLLDKKNESSSRPTIPFKRG